MTIKKCDRCGITLELDGTDSIAKYIGQYRFTKILDLGIDNMISIDLCKDCANDIVAILKTPTYIQEVKK